MARPKKFNEEQLSSIYEIIKEYTQDIYEEINRVKTKLWQLSVSDTNMAEILSQKGFEVNTKYVERLRRSIDIKPLEKKGGYREGAGRPKNSGNSIDLDYIQVILNHEADTRKLSYSFNPPGGALLFQAGTDTTTAGIGAHTISYDESLSRKTKQIYTNARKYIQDKINAAGAFFTGSIGIKKGKGGSNQNIALNMAYSAISRY